MTNVLGLGGGYFHDSAACLAVDGSIVAFAEEERFTRIKHNSDSRSCAVSAAYCLAAGNVKPSALDSIAVGWNVRWPTTVEYLEDRQLLVELLGPSLAEAVGNIPVRVIPHHRAHAASVFYRSGADRAAVMVLDGSGDGVATSIWRGDEAGLSLLTEYPFTQSLGWFYESISGHVGLGGWRSAGKLMGLAAYGKPEYTFPFLQRSRDSYFIDLGDHGLPASKNYDAEYGTYEYYARMRRAYRDAFMMLGIKPADPTHQWDAASGRYRNTTEFTQPQKDLAASAQAVLEEIELTLARAAMEASGSRMLCLAGGVALNCAANGRLLRDSGAADIYVQPAAGDAGVAVGSALECSRELGCNIMTRVRATTTALGPGFSDADIAEELARVGLRSEALDASRYAEVAAQISAGRAVGWFEGRMEAGPRALGQRSIVADPRSWVVRDWLNKDVKNREVWRPFAPSMLRSESERLIGGQSGTDFMIVAYQATPAALDLLPGVVHADGTTRPHVVEDESTRSFARLLHAFKGETGLGALINTSFNDEREPIVCTPRDAIRTFMSTPLSLLVMGGHLVRKQ